MIKAVFLGTSSMVPTKERNTTSLYVEYNGEGILFDCGEGTQRQMNIVGISRHKIKKIFISHWHGDHVSGLMGLLQTISNKETETILDIYGPVGTKEYMDHLLKASYHDSKITLGIHEFDIETETTIVQTDTYSVLATPLIHSTPVLGFAFVEKEKRRMKLKELEALGVPPGPKYAQLQRGKNIIFNNKTIKSDDVTTIVKGKKLAIILDTRFCPNAVQLAEEADILICEATFANTEEEKAHQYKHMTAQQSAQVASMAGVKKLFLTHFSQRYASLTQLHEDARDVFENVEIANDFKVLKL